MTKKLNEIKTTLNFLRNGKNATEQMTEETCLEVYGIVWVGRTDIYKAFFDADTLECTGTN